MRLGTRKVLDGSFSGLGIFSLLLMCAALVVLLGPIFANGGKAFVFKGTVEWRRATIDIFGRGDRESIEREVAEVEEVRAPVYRMIRDHEDAFWVEFADLAQRHEMPEGIVQMIDGRQMDLGRALVKYQRRLDPYDDEAYEESEEFAKRVDEVTVVKDLVRKLLGPLPDDEEPEVLRSKYGARRWDRAQVHLGRLVHRVEYEYPDAYSPGVRVLKPRADDFAGTSLEPLFAYVEENIEQMLRPRRTFYWRFLFDADYDDNLFGGIWAPLLGTFYLTLGAMVVAAPLGIIAAIYLTEYAGDSRFISLLRTCISTLAGVPSVVFGLFGLAFFMRTLHMPKSVFVGCLTLACLVLPTVIRASEEAIRMVPQTYREASLSMGATKWRTIVKVVFPTALPGIITSIIISMGRAAGETAPILFTAAVAVGAALKPWQVFSSASPALPYSIYSVVTENPSGQEIPHVQFGMVMVLILLVLLLNAAALILRARISRKLRG